MIERLCIVGVGLIGGSVALAARRRGLCRSVVGIDANAENLREALALGVIDESAGDDIALGARGADWIVVATPVGAYPATFAELRPSWTDGLVCTDVGSTKRSAVAAATQVFGEMPANFVPGHPIAGAERSGVAAASPDLYRDRKVILTPTPQTAGDALDRTRDFWTALGAHVSLMDAGHHDEVFAATSHLPHVVAYALMRLLGSKDEREEIFQYAGAGFRDFTRIASSNPEMWRDICLLNRDKIVPLLIALGEEMEHAANLMDDGSDESAAALFRYFSEAREARQRFLARSLSTSP